MARKAKTAEKMAELLREAEVRIVQGETVGEICRTIGTPEHTGYKWRREYGGPKMARAEPLKELEPKNEWLKKAVSEPRRRRHRARSATKWGHGVLARTAQSETLHANHPCVDRGPLCLLTPSLAVENTPHSEGGDL